MGLHHAQWDTWYIDVWDDPFHPGTLGWEGQWDYTMHSGTLGI